MRNLSARQLSLLRFIHGRGLDLQQIRKAHQGTLWSLLYGGLAMWRGDLVTTTDDGDALIEGYGSHRLVSRKRPSNISDRVSRLLKVSRDIRKRLAA